MPRITTSCRTDEPLLDVTRISHGTLTSLDLQASRRFYEEVLGFDVIQVSPVSMIVRKGTQHTYVVVESGEPSTMAMLEHNGIDLDSREAVEHAHKVLHEVADSYGIRRINKLMEQHGIYSFYFQDLDGNWWEALHGRDNGYIWLYEEGRDLTGHTEVDPDLMEHLADDDYFARFKAGRA